jgi:ketosteroid isomerase-like protein
MATIARSATLAVVVLASLTAAAATTQSREAAQVRSARAAQNTAIANHDLTRAATFWTDDVVIRSALGLVVQGRANYRAIMAADSVTVYRREPDRVDVSDNERWPLAFESGTWTGRRASDNTPLIRGRYAAQWIKRDGRWMIRAEVFVALGCANQGCSRPLAVQ